MEITTHAEQLPTIHAEPSIGELMQFAMDKGGPEAVATLEQLLKLRIMVEDRNARQAFVAAMTAFRAECPPIVKNRDNTQFSRVTREGAQRYVRYAPLDEIDRIARPVAAKHGLVWTWNTTVDEKLMHITCRVIHVDGHAEETVVSMPYESKAGSSPQQKYGSTQTYGMRYSLIAALGITTTDEDWDGAIVEEPTFITEKQAADLSDLLEEHGKNKQKFCAWMKVETLADIPADRYQYAVDAITGKVPAR